MVLYQIFHCPAYPTQSCRECQRGLATEFAQYTVDEHVRYISDRPLMPDSGIMGQCECYTRLPVQQAWCLHVVQMEDYLMERLLLLREWECHFLIIYITDPLLQRRHSLRAESEVLSIITLFLGFPIQYTHHLCSSVPVHIYVWYAYRSGNRRWECTVSWKP